MTDLFNIDDNELDAYSKAEQQRTSATNQEVAKQAAISKAVQQSPTRVRDTAEAVLALQKSLAKYGVELQITDGRVTASIAGEAKPLQPIINDLLATEVSLFAPSEPTFSGVVRAKSDFVDAAHRSRWISVHSYEEFRDLPLTRQPVGDGRVLAKSDLGEMHTPEGRKNRARYLETHSTEQFEKLPLFRPGQQPPKKNPF